jgi:hypothetical protein
MQFTCTCCGQVHEGLADLVYAAPDYYFSVPEAERDRRCTLTSDLCSIDDRDFFIRGCLEIPVIGRAEPFTFGAWCSVSRSNFEKYRRIFADALQSHEGPFFGWLSVRLPGYPDTLNLKVMALLRDGGIRPFFELEESEHPLSVERRQGISVGRLQKIHEANLHSAG